MLTGVLRKRVRAKRVGTFHHGDLREALVQAAARAVARDGHVAVSLRPIAEPLGVTQPAVYRHFRNKGELLGEVARRGWLELDAALRDAREAETDRFERVRGMGRAYVRWAQANPHLFRLLSSRIPSEQRSGPIPTLPREHHFDRIGGVVPIDDPVLPDAFRTMWGLIHGLATFVVERVFALVDTDAERLAAADAAIDCYVGMLRTRWP